MSRRQYLLALAVLFVSGLIGGAGVSWMTRSDAAYAQNAPSYAKTIDAQAFRVVDNDGNIHGVFGMGENGEIVLSVGAQKENNIFILSRKSGAELSIFDKNSKKRIMLTAEPNGSSVIALSNENGLQRCSWTVGKGLAAISFNDELPSDSKDKKVPIRAVWGTEENGASWLFFFDKKGEAIWKAP